VAGVGMAQPHEPGGKERDLYGCALATVSVAVLVRAAA